MLDSVAQRDKCMFLDQSLMRHTHVYILASLSLSFSLHPGVSIEIHQECVFVQ